MNKYFSFILNKKNTDVLSSDILQQKTLTPLVMFNFASEISQPSFDLITAAM